MGRCLIETAGIADRCCATSARRSIASVGSGGFSMTARGAKPNDRLNLAIVGCGGQGAENLGKVAGENIVALCDVDEKRAADAFKRYPRRSVPRLPEDARCAAPADRRSRRQHSRSYACTGQPGGHGAGQARLLREAPHLEHRRGTADGQPRQGEEAGDANGHPGHGCGCSQAGIEVIRSGVLGDVTELHVWTDRPAGWWPQGIDRPRDTPPVPRQPGLESLAGRGVRQTVSSRLLPFRLAGMEGLRHRRRRRYGHPQRSHAVCRARARPAGLGGDPRRHLGSSPRPFRPGPGSSSNFQPAVAAG